MLRALLRWAFVSTVMLDCRGPELTPDPAQRPREDIVRLRGDGEAPASPPPVASAVSRLRSTQALVCDGVPVAVREACPVGPAEVARIDDEDDGVILHVRPGVTSERELENRVMCYRALASVGRISGAPGCVLDIPKVDVCVREQDEQVVVDITRTEHEAVPPLRLAVRARLGHPGVIAR